MPRNLYDLSQEINMYLNEIQQYNNNLMNNWERTPYIERDIYVMGYAVKKLSTLYTNLNKSVEEASAKEGE